jgi:hypothetical protein
MLIPSFQSLITAYWADEYSQRSGFAGRLSQLGNNPAERRSELGEVHENAGVSGNFALAGTRELDLSVEIM